MHYFSQIRIFNITAPDFGKNFVKNRQLGVGSLLRRSPAQQSAHDCVKDKNSRQNNQQELVSIIHNTSPLPNSVQGQSIQEKTWAIHDILSHQSLGRGLAQSP